jgi:histidinol-phosphate aminotransferase
MITNGTDQAIDVITRTFTDVGDEVVIPEPSFAMFGHTARVVGNKVVSPSYREGNLEFPTQEVIEAITGDTKLIVICNPNNPTGTLSSLEDIEQIAETASGAIVYVDEAYFEFSGQTAVPLIAEHPNVMVSRTFSKAFALPALRIGYVLANQVYINEMLKVRGPYDVNQAASYAASLALTRTDAVLAYAAEVMGEAKPLVERFFDREGITFYPSAGNFILFKPNNAAQVAETLDQNGVRLRPQHKAPVEDTLRISIGTVSQMQRFIEVYDSTVTKTK